MRTSRSASRSASSLARTGLIVEQSISIDPGRKPSAEPVLAEDDRLDVGRVRARRSRRCRWPRPASLGLAASVAPSSTSGPARPGVRFHTVSGKPARARLAAMAAPIVPKPAKPTLSIGPTVEPTGGPGTRPVLPTGPAARCARPASASPPASPVA